MKLILIIILCSFSLFSAEVVKLYDGGTARCKSTYDVKKSQITNIYNINIKRTQVIGNHREIEMDVTFYKCIQTTKEFKLVKNNNHISSQYTFMGNYVERVDLKKDIFLYNDEIIEIAKANVLKNSATIRLKFLIHTSDLSINQFPGAQDKGNFFFNVSLRSLSQISSNESEFKTRKHYGSFRIFID